MAAIIRIELGTRPGTGQTIYTRVQADGGEQLAFAEGPLNVVLGALIEYLRTLTTKRIGE